MANQTEKEQVQTGKPLQRISWSEKIRNKKAWFKRNADYFINVTRSPETIGGGSNRRDLSTLYNIYNNKFPSNWFTHITDPLNAKDPRHKRYPAKIRPTSMLRTNLDLLMEEFTNRPFSFQVENIGEDGYNTYLEKLSQTLEANLQEHFLAVAQQSMKDAGFQPGQDFKPVPQENQIELPDSIKERFKMSYKDNLALFGQKQVKRAVRESHVRQELLKQFKDWLITGSTRSYKTIKHGRFIYERVSPRELYFDPSEEHDFLEDRSVVVRKRMRAIADVVDDHYDQLTNKDHDKLEAVYTWATPNAMYDFLRGQFGGVGTGEIPEYHVVWKGRKQILHVSYTDPETGQTEIMVLDEDTPIRENMKVLKREWVNEMYETTRLGDNIYVDMRPLQVQRNSMTNFSYCKGPYNGRDYSNTHSDNISVMEMGIPKAILYMITDYIIEKTMAKNKGKIALLDKNTIPRKDGWDDEKTLYYGDAMGFLLLNRNQQGVDRSWNQYQVLDMSLWNDLRSLIELRDSFSREWDELLGINPQRKAQIVPDAGLGTTQAALAQSSVITGMIFTLFEQFIERELQGFLDFSKFMASEGIKAAYTLDDFDRDLIELDPNEYCWAELGLFIDFSAAQMKVLQQYKQQVQAMIQNGVKQSTILEIQRADNVAELLAKLKVLEDKEIEMAQRGEEEQHRREMEVEAIKERYEKLKASLDIDKINAEWDRRDENEMIKGSYQLYSFGSTGDSNDNGVPDSAEIARNILETRKALDAIHQQNADRAQKDRHHKSEMDLAEKELKLKEQEMKSRERIEKQKARTALKNKVTGEK